MWIMNNDQREEWVVGEAFAGHLQLKNDRYCLRDNPHSQTRQFPASWYAVCGAAASISIDRCVWMQPKPSTCTFYISLCV